MKGFLSKTLVLILSLLIASLAQENDISPKTRGSNAWYLMNQLPFQETPTSSSSSSSSTATIQINGTNYTSMFGIETVDGEYVGSLDAEDWVRYDLNISTAGSYLLELQVSSPMGEGGFVVGNAETRTKFATIYNIPVAQSNARWQTLRVTVELPTGSLPMEIRSSQNGWNLKAFSLILQENSFGSDSVPDGRSDTNSSTAFPGTNSSAPTLDPQPTFFEIIAADDFVTMHGGDLQTSSEGLDNIGWLDPSDYVIYNLSLPYSATYELKTRVASPDGQGSFQIINNETLEVYAEISNLPKTGDWQIWQTVSNPIHLPEGSLSLRFVPLQAGWNLIWYSLELLEIDQSSFPSLVPSSAPSSTASSIPTGLATSPPLDPPTNPPARNPTARPTPQPTPLPTRNQFAQPTRAPVGTPTWSPRQEEESFQASRFETAPVEEIKRASSGELAQQPTSSPFDRTPTWSPRERLWPRREKDSRFIG